MDRKLSKFALPAALVFLLTAVVACGPSSPEEKIAATRAEYTIELNSWRVIEPEPPVDVAEAGEEGVAAEAAMAAESAVAAEAAVAEEEAGEGEAELEEEAGPRLTDIEFDLVIYFRGSESLPGITVDITQADANEQEKAIFRQYVETDGIVKGETRQAAFVLEGLEIEDGDIFAASVKPGIPADLAEYREFATASP